MPGKTEMDPSMSEMEFRGFNEAPAKCRGKRMDKEQGVAQPQGFNEAPAKCRGKPTGANGSREVPVRLQ